MESYKFQISLSIEFTHTHACARAHTHTHTHTHTQLQCMQVLQMLYLFIFSLFMSSVRPRPDSHPTLYLVVVGGVAPSELRCVHEAIAASKTNVQVSECVCPCES